jgi:copper ion binding protein
MENITMKVTGMSCAHCVKTVNNVLNAMKGITDVKVSLKEGTASFKYDPALIPLETIKTAIKDEGYEVE